MIAYAITISVIVLTVASTLYISSGVKPPELNMPESREVPIYDTSAKPGSPESFAVYEAPDSGYMTISMAVNPVLRNGEADLQIYNDPLNEHTQVVEIYEDSTGDLLYRSGIIPVGYSISSAPLLKSLSAGDYACTARFQSVNPDTGELYGTAAANIKLTVIN